MPGLRLLLALLQAGLLLLVLSWVIDAAKLVRWALFVSRREAKDDAHNDSAPDEA